MQARDAAFVDVEVLADQLAQEPMGLAHLPCIASAGPPKFPGSSCVTSRFAIADGGNCVTDFEILRGQEDPFGSVASESAAHRVIKSISLR